MLSAVSCSLFAAAAAVLARHAAKFPTDKLLHLHVVLPALPVCLGLLLLLLLVLPLIADVVTITFAAPALLALPASSQSRSISKHISCWICFHVDALLVFCFWLCFGCLLQFCVDFSPRGSCFSECLQKVESSRPASALPGLV